ncbi:MAG: hypothetical protein O7B26_12280, partial [Planctomycetota bacterium]|nr:hypothetical protein [Planctomycetota bacterium]
MPLFNGMGHPCPPNVALCRIRSRHFRLAELAFDKRLQGVDRGQGVFARSNQTKNGSLRRFEQHHL